MEVDTKADTKPHVLFRGKAYRLWKRGEKRGSPWWVRVQVMGKDYPFSTDTSDMKLAKDRAKVQLAKILDGNWKGADVVQPRDYNRATVGDVLKVLDEHASNVKESTAKNYRTRLILLIREVTGCTEFAAKKTKLSSITAEMARAFQAQRQGLKRVETKKLTKANTTANAVLRAAKAIFSKRNIADFEAAGLTIPPCIREFTAVPLLVEASHRYSDNPIPQSCIDRIDKALPGLREKDERLWAIHLMVRLLGMRDSEILAARRSWLGKEDGQWCIRIIKREEDEWTPKRSEGSIAVPDVLMEYFKRQDDYLIPATSYTTRYNLIYRRHNEWLRKFLPPRVKGAHELRKHFGALIATKEKSIYVAAQMLRVSLSVAEHHYTALIKKPKALSLEDYRMQPN